MEISARHSLLTVARNSIVLLVGELFIQAISFGLGVFAARSLGDAGYGRYVAAFAFAAQFAAFTTMGLDRLLTREMARAPQEASRLLRDAAASRLVLSVMVYVALIGATYVLGLDAQQRALALLAGAVKVANSLANFLRTVFQAFERMDYQTLTRLSERVVAAVLVFALLMRWPNAMSLVCGLLAASVAALVVTFALACTIERPRGTPVWRDSLTLLREGLPFGITDTALGMMARLDVLVVSFFCRDAEVGWYGVAANVVMPLTLLPQVLSTSLFPRLSILSRRDSGVGKAVSRLSLRWMLLLGVPLGICLAATADKLVVLVFGSEYAAAILPLRILGLSLILLFGRIVLSNVLGATDRQGLVAVVVIIMLLLTALLGLLFVPRAGIAGAALAVVGREIFGFAVLAFAMTRAAAPRSLHRLLVGPFVAGLAMAAAMWALRDLGLLWVVLAGLSVYVLALVLTRTVSGDDWSLVRQVLSLPGGWSGKAPTRRTTRDLP